MIDDGGERVARHDRAASLVDPKLRPPRLRTRLVPRGRLLEQLRGGARQLVVVTAPAGYGKTTLLAQWAASDPRSVAWLTVDDLDNDPVVLRGWLAAAVERLPGAAPRPAGVLTSRVLGAMVAATQRPVVLVVDDVHLLQSLEARDCVTDLLPYLAEGSSLVVAGRASTINLGRLRVEADLLELGPDDLALDESETQALLAADGMEVDPATAERLRQGTEGWAAIVSLVAVAARGHVGLPVSVSGDGRVVAEYLHSEIMASLEPEVVGFLRRSAVLDELSGPACDFVLGRSSSAEELEAVAARNMLVQPVGDGRGRFRYHPILRDLLLGELARDDANELVELRRRAARWAQENRDGWSALQYLYDAGDLDEAAHQLIGLARQTWAAGRASTVEAWFTRLEQHGVISRHPELAAIWVFALTFDGRAVEADRWLPIMLRESDCRLPDTETSHEAWRALTLALRGDQGPSAMRQEAERALERMAPSNPLVATALGLCAMSDLLVDDLESAESGFADAAAMARRRSASVSEVTLLGYLGYVRSALRRWDAASEAVEEALATASTRGIESYATTAIAYAVAAKLRHRAKDEARSRALIARFDSLRPSLTNAMPYLSIHSRLAVAAIHQANGDVPAARVLVTEMEGILKRVTDGGNLGRQVTALSLTLGGGRRASLATGSTLTTAELRLLPLLPTHLSFRGIGERLFLSPHTIKTQALSIYRKLEVTSRDQAVTRARELGLIND